MENIVVAKEYNSFQRSRLISALCEKYSFIKRSQIGKSCSGNDITALKIGAADEYALLAAAFHGSERITATVLLMFIERLCEAIVSNGSIAGINARRALRCRGVIFVPAVNPDGCDISLSGGRILGKDFAYFAKMCGNDFTHWSANLRGVDINHNFNADWGNVREREKKAGIHCPGPTKFGGYSPESEPETVALTGLCRSIKISHALALHSQGEVIYWRFGDEIPPKSRRMAEIMATASGYELADPEGTAVGGGFKDWFISEFNRPAFTVEIGKGENPLPAEKAYDIYRRICEMLMLFTVM